MTSVNYNASATAALRTLQATNSQLDAVQNRVSTGYKIGEAKDNAAYWSISTTLKSDNKSLATVKDALGLGAATVDVAYEGLNSAKDVLDEIKSKLTAATQDGVDRSKIQSEIAELQKQLKSIADSSIFSGENWLSVDSSSSTYNATKSVVASFSRDAQGAVSVGTINVDTSTVKLYDASASATGIIDSAVSLKKSDGTALMVGGTNTASAPPATQGLDTAVSKIGTNVAGATQAIASLGKFDIAGLDVNDTLKFDISVDGSAARQVSVSLENVTDANSFAGKFAAAFTAAGVTGVTAANDGGVIKLTSASSGANSSVVVTNLAAFNGNNKTATVGAGNVIFGLTNTAATAIGTGTAATATQTAAYANGGNVAVGDKLKFVVEYNGDVYDAVIDYSSTTAGNTEGAFESLLNTAIANAVKRYTGAAPSTPTLLGAGNVTATVSTTTQDIVLTTTGKGVDQKVSIAQVTTVSAAGTTAANITKGLGLTTNVVGTGDVATYDLTSFLNDTNGQGDTLSFDVTIGSDKTGANVATRKTVSFTTASTAAELVKNAQLAFDAAFGQNVVTVSGDFLLKTVRGGPNESITVNGLSIRDGDGRTTSLLGMTNTAAAGADDTVVAAATATAGSSFLAQTFGADDKVSFDVALNGAAAKTVTIDKSVIDSALTLADGYTAGSGAISTSAQYLKVVQKGLANAGVTGMSASIVASGTDAGKLRLTTTATGAGNSVTISNVKVEGASTADTMSIDKIDVTDAGLAALGVTSADRKDVLTAYISVVNEAINKITSAAATLGSVSSRIELQQGFVNKLMDTIDKGVSGLVDADMSEESTKLQALQTKQQLGVQALSIANSSAQNILSLFR